MMNRLPVILVCFGLAFVSCGMWCAGAVSAKEAQNEEQLDVIVRVDGTKPVYTRIIEEDCLLVMGKTKALVKIPAYVVADVVRVDRPPEYDQGMDLLKKRKYEAAAKCLDAAMDAKDCPWLREYCNYRLGEAMFDGQLWDGHKGNTYTCKPPADYFEAALKVNPMSRFMLDMVMKRPFCLMEQESFEQAGRALRSGEKAVTLYRNAWKRMYDVNYLMLADYAAAVLKLGDARLMERSNDLVRAIELFILIQRMVAKKFPPVYTNAFEGELRCLMGQKRFSDAKTRAELVIEKYRETAAAGTEDVLPGAYSGSGRASLAMVTEYWDEKDTAKAQQCYADARRSYLQVLIQFPNRTEYLEEATYFVGLCYFELARIEPQGREIAIRYWLKLRQEFPEGRFSKYAVQDLARAGHRQPDSPVGGKQ